MKKLLYLLVLVLLLSSCSSASAKPPNAGTETALSGTTTPSPTSAIVSAVGPTEAFITQVMATKYAAQTQYASLPTITPTPTIPPDSPACIPAALQTSFESVGSGQHILLSVQVTNKGSQACFLPSWPAVQLLDSSGKALDLYYDYIYVNSNPSTLPPTQQSNPGEPLLYGLAVNQSALLQLLWGNWCGGVIPGGVTIRMPLLRKALYIDIPTDVGGGGYCDDPASRSTIDIMGFGY